MRVTQGFGAFTGELTPEALLDAGVSWTLIGHSERRRIVGESDALSAEKAVMALNAGLGVVFCVGETLEEREAGKVR
jgi:triosephosphate isomerase